MVASYHLAVTYSNIQELEIHQPEYNCRQFSVTVLWKEIYIYVSPDKAVQMIDYDYHRYRFIVFLDIFSQ